MLVVIRVGGSVIASPTNVRLVSEYAKLIRKLEKDGHKTVTIVGGGALAREFIDAGRQIGLSIRAQDWLAIYVSRLYALLLSLKISENGVEGVPDSIEEALKILEKSNLVVMGGLQPGMTTDAVAARVCEKTKAHLLVKATDQDGVYNKDPRKYKDAKKLDRTTFSHLNRLLAKTRHEAGIHQILDPVALKLLQRIKTKTIVLNGYTTENIQRAIEGQEIGTTIM